MSNETVEIPLTRGLVAKVDASDLVLVEGSKWQAHGSKTRGIYAVRRRKGVKEGKEAMHRVILGLGPPSADSRLVDHINGDKLDNRRSNLRLATQAENSRNAKKRSGSSRFRGVSKHGRHWAARIRSGDRQRHLGRFVTEQLAALAYDLAAIQAHKDFASLNFPRALVEQILAASSPAPAVPELLKCVRGEGWTACKTAYPNQRGRWCGLCQLSAAAPEAPKDRYGSPEERCGGVLATGGWCSNARPCFAHAVPEAPKAWTCPMCKAEVDPANTHCPDPACAPAAPFDAATAEGIVRDSINAAIAAPEAKTPERCGTEESTSGWLCSREPWHADNHVAYRKHDPFAGPALAVWPASPPTALEAAADREVHLEREGMWPLRLTEERWREAIRRARADAAKVTREQVLEEAAREVESATAKTPGMLVGLAVVAGRIRALKSSPPSPTDGHGKVAAGHAADCTVVFDAFANSWTRGRCSCGAAAKARAGCTCPRSISALSRNCPIHGAEVKP